MYSVNETNETYYLNITERCKGLIIVKPDFAYSDEEYFFGINPFTEAVLAIFYDEVVEVDLATFQKAFTLVSNGEAEACYQLALTRINPTQDKNREE